MNNTNIYSGYFEEPFLQFGAGNKFLDQKMGLILYGPYSNCSKEIQVGIIGSSETVDQVKRLLGLCTGGVNGSSKYPLWTPDFSGFTKVFGGKIVIKDEWCNDTITDSDIEVLEKLPFYKSRIGEAVNLFCKKIEKLQEREGSPTVFICAPPLKMMALCIPKEGERVGNIRFQRANSEKGKTKLIEAGFHPAQTSLLGFQPDLSKINEEIRENNAADNFHHFLKARAMRLKAATQFMRPDTLNKLFDNNTKRKKDMATVCWNLSVALFYKSGGQLWRLTDIPAGTCYIGITFYKEKKVLGNKMGTSLAQIFTPEGEGLVIRGERFHWPEYKEPHLNKESAQRLLSKAINTYKEQVGNLPTRIVLHKSSTYDDEERSAFKSVIPEGCRHDFVSILERSQKRIKFFRQGYNPILRGTVVTLPDKSRLIYTKGYVSYMKIYPGPRVPRPLDVLFDETDTSHDTLSKEILGLSRMNWNSADFSCLLPITMQFSRWVGQILRELPPGVSPASRFLYYM